MNEREVATDRELGGSFGRLLLTIGGNLDVQFGQQQLAGAAVF